MEIYLLDTATKYSAMKLQMSVTKLLTKVTANGVARIGTEDTILTKIENPANRFGTTPVMEPVAIFSLTFKHVSCYASKQDKAC